MSKHIVSTAIFQALSKHASRNYIRLVPWGEGIPVQSIRDLSPLLDCENRVIGFAADQEKAEFMYRAFNNFNSDTANWKALIFESSFVAEIAHGDQKYGDEPYVKHLQEVVDILKVHPYGDDPRLLIVGYLHDVLEDCPVTVSLMCRMFGNEITRLVQLVTDEPGIDRAERKLATNAKLAKVRLNDCYALLVKAADRLANLRRCSLGANWDKLDMYAREHVAFRLAVYRRDLCDSWWEEMDTLVK